MTDKKRDLSKLSDDELQAHIDDLAKQRTAIREQQVEAANEQAFRLTLAPLSPTQREALAVRMGGSVNAIPETTAEKAN